MEFSGMNKTDVRTLIKYEVTYKHRKHYAISIIRRFFDVSRGGYYDFVSRKNKPCKDDELIKYIQYARKAMAIHTVIHVSGYDFIRRVFIEIPKQSCEL